MIASFITFFRGTTKELPPIQSKHSSLKFRRNEIETQDGFFHYSPEGKISRFVSIDKVYEELGVMGSDGELLRKLYY
jgi:hypothetical protein